MIHADASQRGLWERACRDFIIAPDPVEANRVNLYEQWETEEHLTGWRRRADPPRSIPEVERADVRKLHVDRSAPPFD